MVPRQTQGPQSQKSHNLFLLVIHFDPGLGIGRVQILASEGWSKKTSPESKFPT